MSSSRRWSSAAAASWTWSASGVADPVELLLGEEALAGAGGQPTGRLLGPGAPVGLGRDVGRVLVDVEGGGIGGGLRQPDHGDREAEHLDRRDLQELDLGRQERGQRIPAVGERACALQLGEADRPAVVAVGRVAKTPAAGLRALPGDALALRRPPPADRPPRVELEADAPLVLGHLEAAAGGAQPLGHEQGAPARVEPLVATDEGTGAVLGHPGQGEVVRGLARLLDDERLQHPHPADVGVVDAEALLVHLIDHPLEVAELARQRRPLDVHRHRRRQQVKRLVVEDALRQAVPPGRRSHSGGASSTATSVASSRPVSGQMI